jgi:hypothetical protein
MCTVIEGGAPNASCCDCFLCAAMPVCTAIASTTVFCSAEEKQRKQIQPARDRAPSQPMTSKITRRHPLQWLLEPLEGEPSFFQKAMFGCQAVYMHGKLVACLAADEEPWNGLLVCTSREFHPALIGEFPALKPHPVLGKWLYLPQAHESFEGVAQQLVQQILQEDARIGVEPGTRRRKRSRKEMTPKKA